MILTQTQIESIVQKIIEGYQPEKIILFGSYAKGNPTLDSDLDLMIIKKTDERPLLRNRTIRRLFNPYPCPLDIFVYTPVEFHHSERQINTIANIVSKEGIELYARTS